MEKTVDETTTPLSRDEIFASIEAAIYVSEEPMTVKTLLFMLADAGVTKADVTSVLTEIQEHYVQDPSRGFELRCVAGGYQFRTKTSMAKWLQRLNVPKPTKLSQPAAETMAIIAYRQPIVRSEIEALRGVDSGQVIKTLLERDLIRIMGKSEDAGSPLIYATTDKFLSTFNLPSLQELPSLKDIQELERPTATDSRDSDQAELITMAEEFPVPQVDIAAIEARERVDSEVMTELEEQIRDLRKLERILFPKEETTVIATEVSHASNQAESLTSPADLPITETDSATEDLGPRD